MVTERILNKNVRKSDGMSNLGKIIKLILRYWYLFAISLPIALGSVFFYHRYTVPVFQASATILFKSAEPNVINSTDLMEGFGLSPEIRNLENQTFIIRSYKIVRQAVEKIDFGIEYYIDGFVKDSELYGSSPFRVVIDSAVSILPNIPIGISIHPDGSLTVSVTSEESELVNLRNNQITGMIGPTEFSKKIQWGETIHQNFGKFRVEKNFDPAHSEQTYFFRIRLLNDVAAEYRSRLGVSTYREGSSIVFLTVSGTSAPKICHFLDELCKVVIDYNLQQKNEIATRSILFIQSQLETISDTLEKTQNILLDFRKQNRFMEPSSASEQMAKQYFDADKEKKLLELKRDYYNHLKSKLQEDPYSTDFMLPAFSDNHHQMVSQLVM